MNLSDISIKNPVFAVMLSAAMVVFGYLGYRDMGISQFPEIDFPVVNITTYREASDPETTDFTRDRWTAVLGGATTGAVPASPDDGYVRAIRGGRASAPLVGGCLWLLMQTMGTPWEIELEGCILFFEDVDLPTWHLDGFLVQLLHAGKLDSVAGVVVGEMAKCDWPHHGSNDFARTKSVEDVLEDRLEPLGIPVLYGLPLGHGKHQAALPLGVTATLDADARALTIDEPALSA